MADEDKVVVTLDADDAAFIEKVLNAKKTVKELGDKENFSELTKQLSEAKAGISEIGEAGESSILQFTQAILDATPVIAGVGAAFLAVKASLDFALEAENIRAINAEFESLTANAGVSGEELKASLLKAADGMMTETEVLDAANKGIVQLGGSSDRMGEVMEVARRRTAAFGGDLKTNFEQLNQALAMGNQRMLKRLGIHVDMKKAEDDFAATLGVTRDELTEAGKQQAHFNAGLDGALDATAALDPKIKETTNTWTQLKTTLKEIGETAIVAFDKIMGPTVKGVLKDLAEAATTLKDSIIAKFSEGREGAVAQVKVLQQQLKTYEDELAAPRASTLPWYKRILGEGLTDEEAARVKARIDTIKDAITKANLAAQMPEAGQVAKGLAGGPKPKEAVVDDAAVKAAEAKRLADAKAEKEKELQLEVKFEAEINSLRLKRVNDEIKNAKTIEQFDSAAESRKWFTVVKFENEKEKVKNNKLLDDRQRAIQLQEIEIDAQNAIRDNEAKTIAERQALQDQLAESQKNGWDKFVDGAKSGLQESTDATQDYASQGKFAFGELASAGENSLMALGEGAKGASKKLEGFFLSALGSIAEAQGRMHLLAGITSGNVPEAAGGAALLVLAGILKSAAGSAGASSPASASAGAGATSSAAAGVHTPHSTASGTPSTSASPSSTIPSPSQMQPPAPTTQIIVQGHMLGTDESQRWLLDQIRQASDKTDFAYVKVGSTY